MSFKCFENCGWHHSLKSYFGLVVLICMSCVYPLSSPLDFKLLEDSHKVEFVFAPCQVLYICK